MKKILTMAMAALFSVATFAQTTGDRVLKIKTTDGESTALMLNTVKDITVEPVTPLSMDIEVSNITETSMDIDFPMPAGCKYWLMCIQEEEITGTDLEVRNAIRQKYNEEFSESKFLRIPNFKSGTTYYIYALMFDEDGVPAGLAKTSATTLKKEVATDEFTIDVSDITKTTASVKFTPKDNKMTYYCYVVPETDRTTMIDMYGSIQKSDLEYLKYSASSIGYDLSEYLSYVLVSGTKTYDTRDLIQTSLEPGTKYYAYCYGMEKDGTFTTAVYEKEFTTEAVQPSENVITCNVVKTYTDGCDVKVTTTNNDPYIVTTQTAEVWQRYLNNNNGDKVAAAKEILRISYGGYADSYTYTGDHDIRINTRSENTDCVLIVCGYDASITTDVQIVEYKTVEEKATDEFALEVTDITKSTAKISITPKDKSMTYYYKVLSETERAKLIEQYGSIQKADLQDIQDYASSMGFGIDMFLPYRLTTGTKTEDVKNLVAGTKYYLYAYGWNGDGTFTTDIYEKEFTTEAAVKSSNVITVEVGDTYVDGCDVKVTTTNNDPYIVDVRSKSYWEYILSQNNNDKVAAAQYIVSHLYGSTAEAASRKGNQEFKATADEPDTDYVLVVFGYDASITTDVQVVEFKTLEEKTE